MVQYSSEIGDNDYDGHDDHGGDVDHRHHDNYGDDIDDYNEGAPTSAKRRPQSGRVRRTGDFFFSIKYFVTFVDLFLRIFERTLKSYIEDHNHLTG